MELSSLRAAGHCPCPCPCPCPCCRCAGRLMIACALRQREARRWRRRRRLKGTPGACALQSRHIVSRPLGSLSSAAPISTFSGACAQRAWSPGILRVRRRTRWAEAITCLGGSLWQKRSTAWGTETVCLSLFSPATRVVAVDIHEMLASIYVCIRG